MGKQGRKLTGFGLVAILALVGFVAAAAVAFYVASGGSRGLRPHKQTSSPKPPVVTLVSERRQVTLFLPRSSGERVYLAPVIVKAAAKGANLDTAVAALLAAGSKGGQAAGLIPDGTRVLSPVKVENGVATLNLSKEFVENFDGGSDEEALTLNAIVHTLVHNGGGDVQKVQILVEGEKAESLGGHFDLTEPVEADSTMLEPGSATKPGSKD